MPGKPPLIYLDRIFLQHDTGQHPECADRLTKSYAYLEKQPFFQDFARQPTVSISQENLLLTHTQEHVEHVKRFSEKGGGRIESDTVVSQDSYAVALQAAGTVCDAVHRVLEKNASTAACLVRPPGHHALQHAPMGFCLFNNVSVAAKYAIKKFDLNRILIVDWDVHHGNGTQDIFYKNSQVAFFSIHRWPFYPGSGTESETGSGDGLGFTLNLPTEYGTPRKDYLKAFETELERFASKIKPDLVLISAGFDSHRLDPVGSLGLEIEDFASLTHCVTRIAKEHCEGQIVSVLEGGYNVEILPKCIGQHLQCLIGANAN